MNIVEKVASQTAQLRPDAGGQWSGRQYEDYGPKLQPWPPPFELSESAIRESVVTNGQNHDLEFLVAINGNRDLIESVKGESRSVKISEKLWNSMIDPSSQLDIHHNHFAIAVLSSRDLSYLVYKGVKTIFAHAPNGGSICTAHASLSERGREVVDRLVSRRGEESVKFGLEFTLDRDFDFREGLQNQVRAGIVDVEEATICDYLALPEAMNRTGLFVYQHNYLKPPLFFRHDIQRGIDEKSHTIANSLSIGMLRRGASCRLSNRHIYDRPCSADGR